jgi:hypothetical protein
MHDLAINPVWGPEVLRQGENSDGRISGTYQVHTGMPEEQDMPAPTTITIFSAFALAIALEIL